MSTQKAAVKKCKIISAGKKTNKKHSDTRSFCYVAFTLWSKLPDTPKCRRYCIFSAAAEIILFSTPQLPASFLIPLTGSLFPQSLLHPFPPGTSVPSLPPSPSLSISAKQNEHVAVYVELNCTLPTSEH